MKPLRVPSAPLLIIILVICVTIRTIDSSAGGVINYKNQLEWPKVNPQCSGRQQSPIDIETKHTKLDTNLKLELLNYGSKISGSKFHIENNGHTLQLTLKVDSMAADEIPTIRGSAVNGTFQFRQLHFHWHEDNDQGSEHAIDGHRYAMEMHYVHVNTKYDDAQAIILPDGLAVLGTLFQVVRKNNTFLYPLIKGLNGVTSPGTKEQFGHDYLILDELLPNNLNHYFKYYGSLTTPPCSESVTWIVFSEITGISLSQIQSFQRLQQWSDDHHGKTEPMSGNVRDLQKRQKREIFVSGSGFTIFMSPFILASTILISTIFNYY